MAEYFNVFGLYSIVNIFINQREPSLCHPLLSLKDLPINMIIVGTGATRAPPTSPSPTTDGPTTTVKQVTDSTCDEQVFDMSGPFIRDDGYIVFIQDQYVVETKTFQNFWVSYKSIWSNGF